MRLNGRKLRVGRLIKKKQREGNTGQYTERDIERGWRGEGEGVGEKEGGRDGVETDRGDLQIYRERPTDRHW